MKLKFNAENIQDDYGIYKDIFMASSAIMILVMQLYVLCVANGWDPVSFAWVESRALSIILQIVTQVIGFAGINVFIFWCVFKIKERQWIKDNRQKMLQGRWLHIHDKDNVRIGVVTVHQRFSAVDVRAFNIAPKAPGISDSGRTKWEYLNARIYPPELSGIEFFGCYVSRKKDGTINQGVHIFDTVDVDADGYPTRMMGSFCDTFRVAEEKVMDIRDRKGQIVMYKMTPALEKAIYGSGGINYEALAAIADDPNCADEPFVQALRSVIDKYSN